jgi:hypothetical protein
MEMGAMPVSIFRSAVSIERIGLGCYNLEVVVTQPACVAGIEGFLPA